MWLVFNKIRQFRLCSLPFCYLLFSIVVGRIFALAESLFTDAAIFPLMLTIRLAYIGESGWQSGQNIFIIHENLHKLRSCIVACLLSIWPGFRREKPHQRIVQITTGIQHTQAQIIYGTVAGSIKFSNCFLCTLKFELVWLAFRSQHNFNDSSERGGQNINMKMTLFALWWIN